MLTLKVLVTPPPQPSQCGLWNFLAFFLDFKMVPLVLKKNTRRKSGPSISSYQLEEEKSQVLLFTRPASALGHVNRLDPFI